MPHDLGSMERAARIIAERLERDASMIAETLLAPPLGMERIHTMRDALAKFKAMNGQDRQRFLQQNPTALGLLMDAMAKRGNGRGLS